MSDDDLKQVISTDAIAALQRVAGMLGNESPPNPMIVTSKNFVQVVPKLRELYEAGSRQLGEAIIEASRFLEAGQHGHACDVYRNFLTACPSRFYKEIAEGQLRKLDCS